MFHTAGEWLTRPTAVGMVSETLACVYTSLDVFGDAMKPVILFLSANGDDQARLAVSREAREAREAIRAVDRTAFDFRAEADVAPDELVPLVQQYQPTVLHFSGHGYASGDVILDGGAISPAVLLAVVTSCPKIRVVVLNACFSEKTTLALVKRVPVVIGMRQKNSDDVARAFSWQLYFNLARGDSVQAAFDAAAGAAAATDSLYAGVPQLHDGPAGEASRLILRSAAPEIRAVFEHTDGGKPSKSDKIYFGIDLYIHNAQASTATVVYQLDPEYDEATEEGALREVGPTSPQFRTWIRTEGNFLIRATIWRGRRGMAIDAFVVEALRRHYEALTPSAWESLNRSAIDQAIATIEAMG